MKFTGQPCSHVHVVSNTFDFCSIGEVTGTYCLSHEIIIVLTTTLSLKSKFPSNIHQLGPHFSNFSQRLGLKKMLCCPFCSKVVLAPLFVYVEISKMITFGNEQFLTCCLSFLNLFLWLIEDARN